MQMTVKQLNVGDRSFKAVANDGNIVDRDGERILSSAWEINGGLDNFKANPVILFSHDSKKLPIAKATRIWVEANKLMLEAQFPEAGQVKIADECYNLVKSNILRTLSVGFIPRKSKYIDGIKTFTDCELLEVSLTPLPSNLGSRVISVKNYDPDEEINLDEIEYSPDIDIDIENIDLPLEDKIRYQQEREYQKEMESLGIYISKSEK